jgi:hypothetical protein
VKSKTPKLAPREDLGSLDGKLALREVRSPFAALLQHDGALLRGQTAADSPGLLGPEVERGVLLGLVEEAELRSLLGVDNGEDAGDGLSEVVDLVELGARGGNLLDPELAELSLQLAELLGELVLVLAPELTGLDLSGRHLDW